MSGKKITGVIDWFAETGTEGLIWVLHVDDKTYEKDGHDALVRIEEGDRLTIYSEDGSIAFSDVVVCDRKTGWMEYPGNPGSGQQCALGLWIHWIQDGWRPDDWAVLFVRDRDKEPLLRAELTKK